MRENELLKQQIEFLNKKLEEHLKSKEEQDENIDDFVCNLNKIIFNIDKTKKLNLFKIILSTNKKSNPTRIHIQNRKLEKR